VTTAYTLELVQSYIDEVLSRRVQDVGDVGRRSCRRFSCPLWSGEDKI